MLPFTALVVDGMVYPKFDELLVARYSVDEKRQHEEEDLSARMKHPPNLTEPDLTPTK